MSKKVIIALALMSLCLLTFGVLNVVAQEEKRTSEPKAVETASRHEAHVASLREKFAAERERLGLGNEIEQAGTPESSLGEPECSQTGGGGGGSSASAASAASSPCGVSSKGAAVWKVNMGNLNTYVADTPLWYSSPIGPPVEITLSYNSLSPETGRVGNKWQLNYASYLSSTMTGINIVMPDGRQDLYTTAGSGYRAPRRVFNTLVRLAGDQYELNFPDGKVYVYRIPPGASVFMVLVEIRDAHGQKLSMSHDAKGTLQTITDATGKITTLSYNSQDLLTKVTDPFGRSASFEYDANKNLTKITDMGGYSTSFTYSLHSSNTYYLASLGNPGRSWAFDYEPADRVGGADPYPAPGTAMGFSSRLTVTNPVGGKEEYFKGSAIWHVSAKNYVPYSGVDLNNSADNVPKRLYTFAGSGSIGSVVSPEGNTTSFGYNDYDSSGRNTGNVTSVSKGVGTLSYTYNAFGRVTSFKGWSYPQTSLAYAANGVDLTGITDGLGTITLTYNGSHDVTSVTDRLGNTTTSAYNPYGQLTSVTDPLGTVANFNYDSNHLLSTVTIAGQVLASYTYDSFGRIRTFTDSAGMKRTYDYSNLDEITKITYPDGKSVQFTYSSGIPRLVASVTDRAGKTTGATHTAFGEITSIKTPDGGTIRFDRDSNGNVVRLVDPRGNATRFEYNNDNRLVKKTFADGTFRSFTHQGGHITSVTNARNASVTYILNASGDPSMVLYMDLPYFTPSVMYQYDAYNRRASMTDGAGTHTYSYDAESRVTQMAGPLANDARTFEYDAKGRLTRYSLQGGQSVSYAYDSLDRLTSVRNSAGTFAYAYSGASPLVQKLTRPNGSYTEYQYDSLSRETGVTNKTSAGEIINQFLYSYDGRDLRSEETIINGAPLTSFQAESVSYTYSRLNQLRTSSSPDRTFSYDADGNMTRGFTPSGYPFTAAYDFENRLTSMKYGQSETAYTYNGDSILTARSMDSGTGGRFETNYVLFDTLALQERDDENKVIREYTWGLNDGGGIGGLLSVNQTGQDYFYLYDGKGNVTALIDDDQTVVASYAYDPFGNLLGKSGTLEQQYQFSTKPYDPDTGLSYFGYRFYAPAIGKWMTRDPLGEIGGLNLYEFAGNNAVNHIDPLGLDYFEGDATSQQEVAKMVNEALKEHRNKCAPPDPSRAMELWKWVKRNYNFPLMWQWIKDYAHETYDKYTGGSGMEAVDLIPYQHPVKGLDPADLGKEGEKRLKEGMEKIEKAIEDQTGEKRKACNGCP